LGLTTPSADISSFISTGRIEVPRITEKPVNIYEMETGEEMAFPWSFPTGKFGFNFNRPMRITRSMYFKHRLYNKRGNFRKDITYLLHSAVAFDVALLKSEINVKMRIRKNNRNSELVTAGDIRNVQVISGMYR